MKFADDNTLITKGIDDVSIRRKNDNHSLILDVLYIFGIKCNLLRISQLFEKSYKIHMEDKMLRVLDSRRNLIQKAHMPKNRTGKIELNVIDHTCLATTASREELI